MSEPKFDLESDFLVKQSKTMNFLAGGIMLLIFFIAMSAGDYGWSSFLYAIGLFLIPGALAIARGRRNTTIIKINKTGFYYAGQLLTDWNLFYDAVVQDKAATGSFKDNFVLDVRYYSPDYSLIYTRSIPLTNTQDKSEEEITEAIKFYSAASGSNASEKATALNKAAEKQSGVEFKDEQMQL